MVTLLALGALALGTLAVTVVVTLVVSPTDYDQ